MEKKQELSARTHGAADSAAAAVVLDAPGKSVYEALCEKINLSPVRSTRAVRVVPERGRAVRILARRARRAGHGACS